MSVTYGFYNSINGDRKYNAEQMSSIFDGIVADGVFQSIGTAFAVKENGGNSITVGIGRAWFNHTWTLNDALLPLTADESEILLDRIDAVVLEVNADDAVRKNSIKIIKGTPATKPKRPTMANTKDLHQYPFAYIHRKAGSPSIVQADITNTIGTEECPFTTGILKVITIDAMVAQWNGEWEQWKKNWPKWSSDWEAWKKNWPEWEKDWEQWKGQMSSWRDEEREKFNRWFQELQVILDGDVATKLANAVNQLSAPPVPVKLLAAGWTGATPPYEQTIELDGVEESSGAYLVSMLEDGADVDTQKAYIKAFGIISSGTGKIGNGTATFKVYKKPVSDCTVGLKVTKWDGSWGIINEIKVSPSMGLRIIE